MPPPLLDVAVASPDELSEAVAAVTNGHGCEVTVDCSPILIHPQVSLHGSWVSSEQHMAELLELLVRWGEHPERIVTHRYPLDQADRAYQIADGGQAGKVCIVWED